MPTFHTPVLARELCEALAPALAGRADAVFVDATCGGGGHTAALLERTVPARIVCFDRDVDALAHATERLRDAPCPIRMVQAPFSRLTERLREHGISGVHAIVADLGVSSHQLDAPERGFSFRSAGPLDLRMDRSAGPSAADLLAQIDVDALTRVLRELGEEPHARRIARAIVAARPTTTRELADLVERASPPERRPRARRIHPATRTFQAIRMFVNDELGELDRFLAQAPELLLVGGRLGVITFHSLEDRRVKRCFARLSHADPIPAGVPVRESERRAPRFDIPSGYARGCTPGAAEIHDNPRARSARLRVLERAHA